MRKIGFALLGAAALYMQSCSDENSNAMSVRITPAITRVTGVYFDRDDRIGLTITRNSTVFADNVMMTYDGSVFASPGLIWYNDLHETSTLTAYYPYVAEGALAEFTVAVDQRAGCGSSDLLAATKTGVTPASAAVKMVFQHLMSQLTIVVSNTSKGRVESITLGGFIPTAEVDYAALKATVKQGIAPVEVVALEVTSDAAYRAVLVPQQGALTLTVRTDDGKSRSKTIASAVLEAGKQYDVSMSVTDIDIDVTLSGDIKDWGEGGSLDKDNAGEDAGTLSYQGEEYRTQQIGGKRWMAENMRYVPAGAAIWTGIWYPYQDETAGSDPAYVREYGMLYDYATATAGVSRTVGVSVRGICPLGWHIPTEVELNLLLGADCDPEKFFTIAGFWNGKLNKYWPEKRGTLMSATLLEAGSKYAYLSIVPGGLPAIQAQVIESGLSLRCVQDSN